MRMSSGETALFRWPLACGLMLAACLVFYLQSIKPLAEREEAARRGVADMRERIADARKTIGEMRTQEQDADRGLIELDRLENALPAGSAMIWLPELIRGHFTRFGMVVAVIRLNATLEDPEMPGYRRSYLSAALPIDEAHRNVTGLLLAVAELEQQHSFVKVLDFAIKPDPENPSRRMAAMNVIALTRQ